MKIKKEITFIYSDSVEKQICEIIAHEASERGYHVKLTKNKFEKCEIGVYCQHVNFPEYSKFSIIMLHDITQQFGNWPDIWKNEPWHIFDIGILPGEFWAKNWRDSSQYFYTRAKEGVFLAGWPKADVLAHIDEEQTKEEIIKEYGLDPNKKTVLYAPSWENDNKLDDFVKAMQQLDVNMLIKYAPADPILYPEQIREFERMNSLHKNTPQVYFANRNLSIINAIIASDLLVSDESSTMCESVMLGKPAVSVSNWLIPDTKPSRFPSTSYDFVIKCTKEELADCVSGIILRYNHYTEEAIRYSRENFGNIGNSSKAIIDIIDHYTEGREVLISPLSPAKRKRLTLRQWIKYKKVRLHRIIVFKYREKYRSIDFLFKLVKRIRSSVRFRK